MTQSLLDLLSKCSIYKARLQYVIIHRQYLKFTITMRFLIDLMRILKGLRNGLYYGAKVRIVHSLVMTLLFKTINKKQIVNILKLGFQHARNLGLFVFGYKLTCIILEELWGKRPLNSFIAGCIFGGLIFGKKTPVNYQIVLYLLSRVLVALITLIYKNYFEKRWAEAQPPIERRYGYWLMAAICWGLVMWIFTIDKSALQASLASSMQFLYIESDRALKSWKQLVPFYIPAAFKRL